MISDSALHRLQRIIEEPDLATTKYELVSELGRGGMGVVYLVRDTELDREVALKVLDWADSNERASARLLREARILARLEHPGIVPVHDVGRLPDGRVFYSMKRVQGQRLDAWIRDHPDLHARLGLFLRIGEAVSFAHAHGVIHRDLKPENVMIGAFGEVLVLDWGVARLHEAESEPGAVSGTPDYMPPEQAAGTVESVDARADIFALGVVLHGLAPASRPVAAIAAKACASRPADRYQTVAELSADVDRFLADAAVSAHAERVRDRLARLGRRYRVPIALVLAYLLMRLMLFWLLSI